jgi:hypothetical protein
MKRKRRRGERHNKRIATCKARNKEKRNVRGWGRRNVERIYFWGTFDSDVNRNPFEINEKIFLIRP